MKDDPISVDCDTFDLGRLCELVNPFHAQIWAGVDKPISKREIVAAAEAGKLIPPSTSNNGVSTRQDHVRRCAWFYLYDDRKHSIDLDFGVPAHGCTIDWWVQDGNHRFLAACARGDATILAVRAGSVDYVHSLNILVKERGISDWVLVE